MSDLRIFALVSGLIFIIYGLLCLLTNHMLEEFSRYGLSGYRRLVGYLELLGGFGLFVGLYYSPLLIISSAGLALLMFLGVMTRIRVKDPFIQITPALVLMFVNGYITYLTLIK